jgi:hypothetical protein
MTFHVNEQEWIWILILLLLLEYFRIIKYNLFSHFFKFTCKSYAILSCHEQFNEQSWGHCFSLFLLMIRMT